MFINPDTWAAAILSRIWASCSVYKLPAAVLGVIAYCAIWLLCRLVDAPAPSADIFLAPAAMLLTVEVLIGCLMGVYE